VLTIAVEHREKGQARGAEKPAAKPAKGGGTKGPRGGAAK
jgi:hypothetical protein